MFSFLFSNFFKLIVGKKERNPFDFGDFPSCLKVLQKQKQLCIWNFSIINIRGEEEEEYDHITFKTTLDKTNL